MKATIFKKMIMSQLKMKLNRDIKNDKVYEGKGELKIMFYHLTLNGSAFFNAELTLMKGKSIPMTNEEVLELAKMIPVKTDFNEIEYCNAELDFSVKGYRITLHTKYKNIEEIKIVVI